MKKQDMKVKALTVASAIKMSLISKFKLNKLFFISTVIYIGFYALFYYKYVPLIKFFQLSLIPILIIITVITAIKIEWGIIIFIFIFPLINNLPYFFGIDGRIPHAPTALVLFLNFFLGWLINRTFSGDKWYINYAILKPITFFSLLVTISFIITFLRYTNFFPFLSRRILELIVNVNHVRAGGALMSSLFTWLDYISGFFFFVFLLATIKFKKIISKILMAIFLSMLITLLFASFQLFYSRSLGNTAFWVSMNQINSTFKDPNSFGAFLAASFPLLLGMIFFSEKNLRLFFIFLGFFSLLIFPYIGSRSAFLSLIGGIVLFFIFVLFLIKSNFQKRLIYVLCFLVIIILIIIVLSLFFKESILSQRLSIKMFFSGQNENPDRFFNFRLILWKAALVMMRDFPITGVGVGAYIVEFPNYQHMMGLSPERTDSALNYFMQIGAELGLVGLLLFFWLIILIINQMRSGYRRISPGDNRRFIYVGIISAIITFFINFIFHTYIASYEIRFFFWLLVSLLFLLPETGSVGEREKSNFGAKANKGRWLAALGFIFLFGLIHLWNSLHALSIFTRTSLFSWHQDFGFYSEEKDDRGLYFQWAKKIAGIEIDNLGPVLVIPMKVSHPDVENNPVHLKIFLADKFFNEKKLIKEISFNHKEWREVEIDLRNDQKKIYLLFKTSRTWQPFKLGISDSRTLSFALGKVWFKYPSEIQENVIFRREKIQQNCWQGDYGASLETNTISKIKFEAHQGSLALRLWVRGSRALGIGPYFILRLDDVVIGQTMLTSEEWRSLVLMPQITPGEHILSVEFINDFFDPEKKLDRNLFLGDLEIFYLKGKE